MSRFRAATHQVPVVLVVRVRGSGYPRLMTETLAIVGAGRVGRALGRRLRELGWKVGAVVTRNETSARRAVRFIGAGTALSAMSRRILQSTCILIATPDSAVASVAEELSRIGGEELKGHVVLHTSGALDSTVLNRGEKAWRCRRVDASVADV